MESRRRYVGKYVPLDVPLFVRLNFLALISRSICLYRKITFGLRHGNKVHVSNVRACLDKKEALTIPRNPSAGAESVAVVYFFRL